MPLFGDVFLPTGTADGRTQQIDTEDDPTSSISSFSYIMSYERHLCISSGFCELAASVNSAELRIK